MLRTALVLASSALVAGACAANPASPRSTVPEKGLAVPPPNGSIFLRASFDDDPSSYLGRFVPDGLPDHRVDEAQAVQTRCSRHVTFKVVNASGSFDESFHASAEVGGSLGVAPVAQLSGGAGNAGALRVKYRLARKMRAELADPDAFDRCCKAAPDGCSDRFVGEFLFGTGSVYQAAGSRADFEANGMAKGVAADLEFKDEIAWKRVTEFENVYFAFRTTAARLASAGDADDGCAWANRVPTSLDGVYFVGVSPPAASEAQARDLALRGAREQVVKWLGERLETASRSTASAVGGLLEDEATVRAAAAGIAARVKDERWCPAERTATPRGESYTVKVLAFLPAAETAAATRAVVDGIEAELSRAGPLAPATKAELGRLREAAK